MRVLEFKTGHVIFKLCYNQIDQLKTTIVGIFYHSHENDPKYHRTEGGGWSRNKGDLFLVCLSK